MRATYTPLVSSSAVPNRGGVAIALGSAGLCVAATILARQNWQQRSRLCMGAEGEERLGDDLMLGDIRVGASRVLLASSQTVAYRGLRPIVEGHCVVAPRRSVGRVSDLSDAEWLDLWRTVRRVQATIESEHGAEASNLLLKDGTARLPHLHAHVAAHRQRHVVLRRQAPRRRHDQQHQRQLAVGHQPDVKCHPLSRLLRLHGVRGRLRGRHARALKKRVVCGIDARGVRLARGRARARVAVEQPHREAARVDGGTHTILLSPAGNGRERSGASVAVRRRSETRGMRQRAPPALPPAAGGAAEGARARRPASRSPRARPAVRHTALVPAPGSRPSPRGAPRESAPRAAPRPRDGHPACPVGVRARGARHALWASGQDRLCRARMDIFALSKPRESTNTFSRNSPRTKQN